MLVAIEGIDGSGKGTQTNLVIQCAREAGFRAEAISFPRYGKTFFAASVADYLNGKLGDLNRVPPRLAALLYAGDRLESRDYIGEKLQTNDLIVADRYVASNVAYQSGRLPEGERSAFIDWLSHIEYEVYRLPKPSLNIFLRVPVKTAIRQIQLKGSRSYTSKRADLHEASDHLLLSSAQVYEYLVNSKSCGAWQTIECSSDTIDPRAPEDIAKEIWSHISNRLNKSAHRAIHT